MIAIPIDSASTDVKSSALFGNVDMFAIYETATKSFKFIDNEASGNGIKTAKFLHDKGVTTTVYSYMGDGPFNELSKNSVDVFYIGKEPIGLSEIIQNLQENKFTKVDSTNASTYLDPGTATENCTCGCK